MSAIIYSTTVVELIDDIEDANINAEDDEIYLSAGPFVLCGVDNSSDVPNGLPVIANNTNHSLTFRNSSIERDIISCSASFRIMHNGAQAQRRHVSIVNHKGKFRLFNISTTRTIFVPHRL